MKFNWGTGIFIFLVIFVIALVGFVIFASRQEVNLVHKDYYQKGVDYSEQMKIQERSRKFAHSFYTKTSDGFFTLEMEKDLALTIDSGHVLLYRPSTYKKDINIAIEKGVSVVSIPTTELLHGRYIAKIYWFSNGVKYEVDKPVNIQ
jgi:hypothetical protein